MFVFVCILNIVCRLRCANIGIIAVSLRQIVYSQNIKDMFSVPNLLTLANLFCGCLAVVFAFTGKLHYVPYCIIAAAVADFLDGMVARWFKSNSALGIQLDSLADMVSFGLVPGIVLFHLLGQAWGSDATLGLTTPAFMLTLFSALRLAKFNIDTRQTTGFLGLPTPSSTLFVVGLLFWQQNNFMGAAQWLQNPWLLYGIVIVISYLLISELPMFSLKFKNKGWEGNEQQWLGISLSFILLGLFNGSAISLSIILYILWSFIRWVMGTAK